MLSAPCFVSGVPLRACKHASSYYVHSPVAGKGMLESVFFLRSPPKMLRVIQVPIKCWKNLPSSISRDVHRPEENTHCPTGGQKIIFNLFDWWGFCRKMKYAGCSCIVKIGWKESSLLINGKESCPMHMASRMPAHHVASYWLLFSGLSGISSKHMV